MKKTWEKVKKNGKMKVVLSKPGQLMDLSQSPAETYFGEEKWKKREVERSTRDNTARIYRRKR